jgi:hypothetical protein
LPRLTGIDSQHWRTSPAPKHRFRRAIYEAVSTEATETGSADNRRLAEYVYNLQEGVENHGRSTKDANALMETLASRYSTFDAINQVPGGEGAEDIVSRSPHYLKILVLKE